MIGTQQIKSTTQIPVDLDGYIRVNVLRWKNSKWKTLSPYLLKTDGNEENVNSGGIIFENFYQGCKVYDKVYDNKVYASRYHVGKEKYLWWDFKTKSREDGINCDVMLIDNKINYDLYKRWRDSLWGCPNPIRYPNKRHRRQNCQFSIIIDKQESETRMDYITARKKIYMQEYIRLIRLQPKYDILLEYLREGKNLLMCEVDVPSRGKKGEYGKGCDAAGNCKMSLEKLSKLMDDPSEAFGHGLALAYSLLSEN